MTRSCSRRSASANATPRVCAWRFAAANSRAARCASPWIASIAARPGRQRTIPALIPTSRQRAIQLVRLDELLDEHTGSAGIGQRVRLEPLIAKALGDVDALLVQRQCSSSVAQTCHRNPEEGECLSAPQCVTLLFVQVCRLVEVSLSSGEVALHGGDAADDEVRPRASRTRRGSRIRCQQSLLPVTALLQMSPQVPEPGEAAA